MKNFYPKLEDGDRTGVLRRQLWQSVSGDVRVNAMPVPASDASDAPALLPLAAEGNDDWEIFLQQACSQALVDHHFVAARTATMQLGVALRREIVEAADDIATSAGMKNLERRRFLAYLRDRSPHH